MANRVVLGALPGGGQGLRVSRPGQNVLTVGPIGKNVAFDSTWAASSRIVVSGTTSVPSGSTTVTISFGETLPSVPVYLMMGRSRNNTSLWHVIDGWGLDPQFVTFGTGQSTSEAQANAFFNLTYNPPPQVRCYTNRIEFDSRSPYAVNLLSYVVLRP